MPTINLVVDPSLRFLKTDQIYHQFKYLLCVIEYGTHDLDLTLKSTQGPLRWICFIHVGVKKIFFEIVRM